MTSVPRAWPADDEILRLVEKHNGMLEVAARELGTDERPMTGPTLRHHLRMRGLMGRVEEIRAKSATPQNVAREEPSGAMLTPTGGTVTSPPLHSWEQLPTPETLMGVFGINPDDWRVEKQIANTWGDPAKPAFQLKIWLAPLIIAEWPVAPAARVKPKAPRPARTGRPKPWRTVILSDPHCPYEDRPLDALIEQMLKAVQPDQIIINGDGMDMPTLSRHKRNPRYQAGPQECVDSFAAWLARKRAAAPDAQIDLLLGNHDQRLRDYMLERAADAYGLKPAGMAGAPPEDLAGMMTRLLHLEDLGINAIGSPGDGEYNRAEIRLAPKLGVRHGKRTGKNALARSAERVGYSLVAGHTHAKGSIYVTTWDQDGEPSVRVAVDTGCLCEIKDGLGYTDEEHPDWQQGCATATVHPDGTFNVEHATYVNGRLLWRDEMYVTPTTRAHRPLRAVA